MRCQTPFTGRQTLLASCLHLHARAHLFSFTAESVVAVNRMRHRIQFLGKTEYIRIVARIPADLEQACRRLVHNEGWELGDLYRSLILLGACGSFLTLRSSKPRDFASDSHFPSVLKQYLGRRAYAPRTGKPAKLMTVRVPTRLAHLLAAYSNLTGRLRSHTYARLLRAGLLVYVKSEQELVERLETADSRAGVSQNHRQR